MSLIAVLPGRAAVTVREINKYLTPYRLPTKLLRLEIQLQCLQSTPAQGGPCSALTQFCQWTPEWLRWDQTESSALILSAQFKGKQCRLRHGSVLFFPPTHSTRQLHHIEEKDGKIFNKNLLHSGVAQEAACGGHEVARSASGPTESTEALCIPVRN